MATPTSQVKVRRIQRLSLDPEVARSLPKRQVAWLVMGSLVLTLMAAGGLLPGFLDLAFPLALGLGLVAASPRQILPGALATAGVVGLTLGVGALLGSSSTLVSFGLEAGSALDAGGLSGSQVLAAGAATGIAAVALSGGDRMQLGMGALAGIALTGLGWWVAQRLLPFAPEVPWSAALHGALLGLVGSQLLVVAGLRTRATDRIPSPTTIKATLAEAYQGPCIDAWQIDQRVAKEAPDQDARDGLGEVAAWVYRLQHTLQSMDRELEQRDALSLRERVADHYESAENADDDFVRERRLATARHLEQLIGHVEELGVERRRTQALREYASAFLEEAGTGLTLARMQPGSHTPDRLDDVLGRLRSYNAEREARRRTDHETVALA